MESDCGLVNSSSSSSRVTRSKYTIPPTYQSPHPSEASNYDNNDLPNKVAVPTDNTNMNDNKKSFNIFIPSNQAKGHGQRHFKKRPILSPPGAAGRIPRSRLPAASSSPFSTRARLGSAISCSQNQPSAMSPDPRLSAAAQSAVSSPGQATDASASDWASAPLSTTTTPKTTYKKTNHKRDSSEIEVEEPSSSSFSPYDKNGNKISRPPNAWILYRSYRFAKMKASKGKNQGMTQAELSKKIAQDWKNEPDSVKAEFDREAVRKKNEHERLYPGYKYQPRKTPKHSKDESPRSKNNQSDRDSNEKPAYVRLNEFHYKKKAKLPNIDEDVVVLDQVQRSGENPTTPTPANSYKGLVDLDENYNNWTLPKQAPLPPLQENDSQDVYQRRRASTTPPSSDHRTSSANKNANLQHHYTPGSTNNYIQQNSPLELSEFLDVAIPPGSRKPSLTHQSSSIWHQDALPSTLTVPSSAAIHGHNMMSSLPYVGYSASSSQGTPSLDHDTYPYGNFSDGYPDTPLIHKNRSVPECDNALASYVVPAISDGLSSRYDWESTPGSIPVYVQSSSDIYDYSGPRNYPDVMGSYSIDVHYASYPSYHSSYINDVQVLPPVANNGDMGLQQTLVSSPTFGSHNYSPMRKFSQMYGPASSPSFYEETQTYSFP